MDQASDDSGRATEESVIVSVGTQSLVTSLRILSELCVSAVVLDRSLVLIIDENALLSSCDLVHRNVEEVTPESQSTQRLPRGLSYFCDGTMPLPSSTLMYCLIGKLVNRSNCPVGHLISRVSTFAASPIPRISRGSCDER